MYILYTSRGIGLAYTKNVMGFNLNLGKFENLTSLNIYRKKTDIKQEWISRVNSILLSICTSIDQSGNWKSTFASRDH